MQSTLSGIPNIGDLTVAELELWMLSLIRISFMVFLLPIFDVEEVPTTVKAGLSFFMSLLIFPALPALGIDLPSTPTGYFMLALRELYIGGVMGFAFMFTFAGLRIAGWWIDSQTGFTMAQLMDPSSGEMESVASKYLHILFGILFLVTGLHIFYVRAIAESFQTLPMGEMSLASPMVLQIILALFGQAFVFGLKAAAPVVLTTMLATIALGIVSRVMPQMNVWLVGMPLKIGIGLGTLSFTLPLMWQAYLRHQADIEIYMWGLLKAMGA